MKVVVLVMFGNWITALIAAAGGSWRLFAITALAAVMLGIIYIADTIRDVENELIRHNNLRKRIGQ